MGVRQPSVVGEFYPDSEDELRRTIEDLLRDVDTDFDATHVVVPHAGYRFSGVTAAHSYDALRKKVETFVVVGPSHYARSDGVWVSTRDWKTPLGTVEVDAEFIDALDGVGEEKAVHEGEHSVEVQIPFLQVTFDNFEIVPIVMGDQSLPTALELSDSIKSAIDETQRETSLVASTDLTHYQPKEVTERQDRRMIDRLVEHDPENFHRIARQGSACGYGPVVTGMSLRDVDDIELLDYRTSADSTGDTSQVVGYASLGLA